MCNGFLGLGLRGFIAAIWAGKISFDSINEKIKHRIITTPIALENAAPGPDAIACGKKAAMVVSTPNVAGIATRLTPRITLSSEWPCFSISALADSPTTIASSTTIPSTIIKANSDTILMVISKKPIGMNKKAPKKETGKPIITQNANLSGKNNANTSITKTPPHTMLSIIISRRPCR